MIKVLDRLLFHSKHWQLFIVFMGGSFLFEFIIDGGVNIITALVYAAWLPLIGIRLNKFLSTDYKFHFRMFLASWVILIVAGAYLSTISIESEPGLLAMILSLLALASFFVMLAFIARSIYALRNRSRTADYFWEVLLLLTFPFLGVWFIQPRLNLLGDQFYR